MLIYLITNKVNGKQYIGQTVRSLSRRWGDHRAAALIESRDSLLYRAMRKHGRENFSIDALYFACSVQCLNYLEPIFIDVYKTLAPNGYNLSSGGNNQRVHPDTKLRLSNSHKGKVLSLEHRAKLSAAKKGKPLGRPSGMKGKTQPLESRWLMGAPHKGVPKSVETRARIGDGNRGKQSWRKGVLNTHCKYGHLLTVPFRTSGSRCRICRNELNRQYRLRVKERRLAA